MKEELTNLKLCERYLCCIIGLVILLFAISLIFYPPSRHTTVKNLSETKTLTTQETISYSDQSTTIVVFLITGIGLFLYGVNGLRMNKFTFPGGSAESDLQQMTSPPFDKPKEDKKAITSRDFSKVEYKILNTLWTKQVNKWPKFDVLFGFNISFHLLQDTKDFLTAMIELMSKNLVTTQNGYFFLTPEGWEYCKKNYTNFPGPQWWPEETIIKEKLDIALK